MPCLLTVVGSANKPRPASARKRIEFKLAAIPTEFQEAANYLAFQAEVILERIENASERAREITVFMRELEREWARERLRALAEEIKSAETAKDQGGLQKLLEEFRTISLKLQ